MMDNSIQDPNEGFYMKQEGEYDVRVRRFTEQRLRAVFEVNQGEYYKIDGVRKEFESPVEVITDWASFGHMNAAAQKALREAGIIDLLRFYHLAEDWAIVDERVREVENSRRKRTNMIVASGTFLPSEYKRRCTGDWDLH